MDDEILTSIIEGEEYYNESKIKGIKIENADERLRKDGATETGAKINHNATEDFIYKHSASSTSELT
jgi:hypothetical protein